MKCRRLSQHRGLAILPHVYPLLIASGGCVIVRGWEAKIKRNMASLARAALESLLRTRNLDRTLTSALPSPRQAVQHDELAVAATNCAPLDAHLGGGFPRGQLSELVGLPSSGRTSLLLQMLGEATARGEWVALVDALDMLDVPSASAAGIDLDRLLWIRGHVMIDPGMCRDMNQRAVEQTIKALTLVLQTGNFGLVVLDVADAPRDAIRRLPFTTWLRLQRIIEGSQTACVLIGSEPMARSAAGLTLRLAGRAGGAGAGRLFQGLFIEAQIVRARAHVHHVHEETRVAFTTVVSPDV